MAGFPVAKEEGSGHDAEESHLEKQGVPLEPEEGLAVVEEGEVEVPHDEERRLVEEPGCNSIDICKGFGVGFVDKFRDNSRDNFSTM